MEKQSNIFKNPELNRVLLGNKDRETKIDSDKIMNLKETVHMIQNGESLEVNADDSKKQLAGLLHQSVFNTRKRIRRVAIDD